MVQTAVKVCLVSRATALLLPNKIQSTVLRRKTIECTGIWFGTAVTRRMNYAFVVFP